MPTPLPVGSPAPQTHKILPLLGIMAVAILSYGRVWLIHDPIWDDNAWLLSIYSTVSLDEYLQTGVAGMRRIPLTAFTYYFFSSHYYSPNYFYGLWHGISTLTLLASPAVLYLIVRLVFQNRLLALLSGVCLVVFPLDYTVPLASNVNYRLGMLFGLVSIYMSLKAYTGDRLHIPSLVLALLSAVLSHSVFMESAVALEPGRMALIGLLHYAKQPVLSRTLVFKTLRQSLPFLLACVPLVIYKMAFKPYGIYEGIYNFDPFFFLNFWDMAKATGHFLFLQWAMLLRHIDAAQTATYIMGVLAIGAALVVLREIWRSTSSQPAEAIPAVPRLEASIGRVAGIHVLAVAGVLILSPAIMFHAFSRPISWGANSSHAVLSQTGYAILLAWVLYRGFQYATNAATPKHWLMATLCVFIGLGVFFNNLNTDMYLKSWTEQTRFWKAFTTRFPALPDKATFFFDVNDNALYSDLRDYYEFEYQLNLLYATSRSPAEFRRYRAYTASELTQTRGKTPRDLIESDVIERTTHLGRDRLQPSEFIVVHYRDGELLVNDEILKRYPEVPYRSWLTRGVPGLPPEKSYTFRTRMKGISP